MSLFGGTAVARASSQYLVEFKAGKMSLNNATNMVSPDKRKGLVYVYQSDDSLMHFCWKDRSSGDVVDDLIIFPDDVMFKHIPPARISAARCDRIYVLKFKASSRKFFFWMQEPKTDKDAEFAEKVNHLLNNPPAPGSRGGGGGGGGMGSLGDLEGLGDSRVNADLQSLLGNMSQQQLMQILASGGLSFGALPGLLGNSSSRPSTGGSLSGSNPTSASGSRSAAPEAVTSSAAATTTTTTSSAASATTTATTPTTAAGATSTATRTTSASGANPIRLTDLQSILSSMNLPPGATAEGPVDLAGVITPENMAPIISNPAANQDLLPHLPQGEGLERTPEELRQTLGSPQFQQAMGTFQAALQSGQLGPLMGQFGMPSDVSAAAAQGNVEAFMQAMEQDENKEEEKEEKEKKKDKEDDLELDD